MRVNLANLDTVDINVPPPFDVDIAVGANIDLDVHLRDIQEYRQNPARVDWLREIEQMIKDGRLSITPVARRSSDADLEEMLLSQAGGVYKQSGVLPTGGPVAFIPVPLNAPAPGVNYRVSLTLEGVAGALPCEVSLLTVNDFLVTFTAPWDGIIHWEITYPA